MHVFACQHGVEECVNNLFQACLFNKVVDTKLQVLLASCLMGSEDPHMKTKECMKKFNGNICQMIVQTIYNYLYNIMCHRTILKLLISIAICSEQRKF